MHQSIKNVGKQESIISRQLKDRLRNFCKMERELEQRSCNPFTHSREVRVAPSGRAFPRGVASAPQPIKGAPLPQREKVGEGADERSFGTGGYLQLALDFPDPEGRAQESPRWKAGPGRCSPHTAGAPGRLLRGCSGLPAACTTR